LVATLKPFAKWHRWRWPLALAIVLTIFNVPKPPCVDDPAYLAVARQISRHPFDPYGFQQFWYERPEPANEVLAPPGVPYWLGLGMALFGERIVLLKLWLFPVALLLTMSLSSLLRHFARGMESPLLCAIVLSPVVLPAFNFMLDLPTFALETSALALMLRAVRRDHLTTALAAGLLAGLACQTKYTGAIVVPVMVGAAVLRRRWLLAFAAASVAACVFLGWETFTHAQYGLSHFLTALGNSSAVSEERPWLALSALTLLGGLGPPVVLIGLAALFRRPLIVAIGAAAVLATYAAIALVPDSMHSLWIPPELKVGSGFTRELFFAWGAVVLLALVIILGRSILRGRFRSPRCVARRKFLILAAWLLLEWLGYAAMTPFPAARRILGAYVVMTMLFGALAAMTCRNRRGRASVRIAVATMSLVGILFAVVDILDSRLEPEAVRQAVARVREREPGARIWFSGHWGFQFEAERLGLQPLVAGQSVLRRGDWFIDAPAWTSRQDFVRDERMGDPADVVRIERRVHVRTLPAYYGGHRPLESWPAPAIEVLIYRIERTWMPVKE